MFGCLSYLESSAFILEGPNKLFFWYAANAATFALSICRFSARTSDRSLAAMP